MTRVRLFLLTSAIMLLIPAAFALSACGGGGDDNAAPAASPTAPKTAAPKTSSGGGEAKVIEVKMTDNKFTPNEIRVPANTEIQFVAKNEGAAVHNMKILASQAGESKDFQSDITVNPGKESKFTAKFTKKGTVKFQCDYHLPDMVGTIIVE